MKKPLIPLLILLVSPLFACNSQKGASSKTYISYGSLYDQSATLISQTELDKKVANEESFLLAMSPGDEKDVHCSCWRTFSSIIDNFVKDHTPIVYKCSVWFAEKYGVTPPESEDPGFAVFENGKLKKQYVYTVKNTPTYFTNKDAFNSFINDITIAPKMIYIDDNQYQEKINENKRNIISYIRKGCSDCGYVLPNVFDPFFKKHDTAQ